MQPYSRRIESSSEEVSLSDSGSGKDEEKTIPFLRRLKTMLEENEECISFFPGHSKDGATVLGRIIVHDRIQVEANVLPRYFNHSSFASLRRQLNYFNFVRLGKGRQRESTYLNDSVMELDDILHLKRRSGGSTALAAGTSEEADSKHASTTRLIQAGTTSRADTVHDKKDVLVTNTSIAVPRLNGRATRVPSQIRTKSTKKHERPILSQRSEDRPLKKRRRLNNPKNNAKPHPRSIVSKKAATACESFVISEDEQEQKIRKQRSARVTASSSTSNLSHISIDLTKSVLYMSTAPDDEILAGCNALLGLSNQTWVA